MSAAMANDVELVRINVPNGTNATTVTVPVEKTTSVALHAGKRSFARRETAPRTGEWKSFQRGIPQGQPITVFYR